MKTIKQVEQSFAENLRLVQNLIDFDHVVLDTAIQNIGRLRDDLDARHPAVADRIGNTLQLLKSLRLNDSMRLHYSAIYNQCVVLIVSHFSSALRDVFVAAAPTRLALAEEAEGLRDKLQFSLGELRQLNFSIRDKIGELVVSKRDLSFQDMKSTVKAFKNYLAVETVSGRPMNNIIAAQAARHVIVHNGSVVDAQFLAQLENITERDLLPAAREGDKIEFTPEQVQLASKSMSDFVGHVCAQLH